MVFSLKVVIGFVCSNLLLFAAAVVLVALSLAGPSSTCLFGQTSEEPLGQAGVCALVTATGCVSVLLSLLLSLLVLFAVLCSSQIDVWERFFQAAGVFLLATALLWFFTSVLASGFLAQTCNSVPICVSLQGFEVAKWVVGVCWVNFLFWVCTAALSLVVDYYRDLFKSQESKHSSAIALTISKIRREVYKQKGLSSNGSFPFSEFIERYLFMLLVYGVLLLLSAVMVGVSLAGSSQCFFGRTSSHLLTGLGGMCGLASACGFIGLLVAFFLVVYAIWEAKTHFLVLTREFLKWASCSIFLTTLLWFITSIVVSVGLASTCSAVTCSNTEGFFLALWTVGFAWTNAVVWAVVCVCYAWRLINSSEREEKAILGAARERYLAIEAEIETKLKSFHQIRKHDKYVNETRTNHLWNSVNHVGGFSHLNVPLSSSRSYTQQRSKPPLPPLHIAPSSFSPRSLVDSSPSISPRTLSLYDEAETVRIEEERRSSLLREEDMRAKQDKAEIHRTELKQAHDDFIRLQSLTDEDKRKKAQMAHRDRAKQEKLAEDERQYRAEARIGAEESMRRMRVLDNSNQSSLPRRSSSSVFSFAPINERTSKLDAARAEEEERELRRNSLFQRKEGGNTHTTSTVLPSSFISNVSTVNYFNENNNNDLYNMHDDSNRSNRTEEFMRDYNMNNYLSSNTYDNNNNRKNGEKEVTNTLYAPNFARRHSFRSFGEDAVVKSLFVPPIAQLQLAQARSKIESECVVSMKLVSTVVASECVLTAAYMSEIDEAARRVQDIVNLVIRKEFGQDIESDDRPEYLPWLTAKNQSVTLSKIYDQYPQALQIKRIFDRADNVEGGGRGFLDIDQFVGAFEWLFSACKKGHGEELGTYLYDVLMSQGAADAQGITWKEFIFYALAQRLLVLKKETKR